MTQLLRGEISLGKIRWALVWLKQRCPPLNTTAFQDNIVVTIMQFAHSLSLGNALDFLGLESRDVRVKPSFGISCTFFRKCKVLW